MQDIVDAALMDANEAASFKKPNDQPQNQLMDIVALRSRSGWAAFLFQKFKMAKIAAWTGPII